MREFLYPIGFIASMAFTIRFILQMIASEKRKESTVTPSFWRFSLFGNILMVIHSFIQVQYPFCMIQTCNAVLSWRNLNLMQEKRRSLGFTCLLLCLFPALVSLLFILQGFEWMRSPFSTHSLSITWHTIGFLGGFLFAIRFWIQWWFSEQNKKSTLGKSFWWTSVIGSIISVAYFIQLGDLVNILGYGLGLIPYTRNLMLLRRRS